MGKRRRTQFPGLPPSAVREIVGMQDDLSGDTEALRAEAIGATTETKTAKYHARFNERVRVLFPTAGDVVSFPPANSQSQNKWIEVLKLGGGNVKLVPTAGLIQGAASVTLTTSGFYYFQSDGLNSWWMQPTGGGGGLTSPVAFADIQQIAANTWLGNITGALGPITANTLAQLKTYIGNMTAGVAGLAPAGSGVATQFLNGNGAYAVPAAGAPVGAPNTLLGNPTAGAAVDIDIAVGTESIVGRSSGNITTFASAVQTCMIRAAGSLFFASAAAGQHLRRSIAGGDLGFSALEVGALGTPIVANVAATNAATNLSCCTANYVAGSAIVSTTIRARARYVFLHTAAPPTLTAELLVNGAVVATAILTSTTVAATHSGKIEAELTIRTTGAGGTAMAWVNFDANNFAANSVDGSVNTTTFAIDTTVARTLELRVRQTAAGPATTTLTVTNGYFERVN
jgi:hypothetical protein